MGGEGCLLPERKAVRVLGLEKGGKRGKEGNLGGGDRHISILKKHCLWTPWERGEKNPHREEKKKT